MTAQLAPIAAADRAEIIDLYARYAHLVDDGDFRSWAQCYTPSGVLHVPALDVHATGQDEIIEFARLQAARLPAPSRHLVFNVLLEPDGARIRGRAYLLMVGGGWGRHAPVIHTSGRYEDELEKLPDGWRFARRTLVLDADS